MAPIAAKAPTGIESTTASYSDKFMKRGRSLRRSYTQRRPKHQQQLPPHFPQAMQGRQDENEANEEDAAISCHPSFQTHRHRDRQSHYIDPRQQMLHLPDSGRPATSRSHMRDWDHQRDRSRSPSYSKKLPLPDNSSQQPQIESHISLGTSTGMTSEEFEALPPTVQRKYFSTLERLRFAQTNCCAGHCDSSLAGLDHSTSSLASEEDIGIASLASDHIPRIRSNSARLYPNQTDYLYGRPTGSGDRQSHTSYSQHKSIILDATDEAFVKINKRQSQLPKLSNYLDDLYSPVFYSTMSDSSDNGFAKYAAAEPGVDSITESFRWLEENEDLDLRLRLDDRQPSPKQGKKKRAPFPRHLSISKLSFGRPSTQLSRPGTRGGAIASPALSEQFALSSLPSPSGHFRRRSRALSLISPNKGQISDDSSINDPAPSHYQDPEARMKLRVYLASPHKFDEAIEFGFPSLYDIQGRETSHVRSFSRQGSSDRMHSMTNDDVESLISDPASPVDMVSPRTPMSVDQPSLEHSPRIPHEGIWPAKVDYAQAPASSREMTLRMTLTRPDLRADEEQMYGWQKPSSAKAQAHDGSAQPRLYTRAANPKDNIEKQFAAIDQDNASGDSSMVKRFWNRVRRS